MALFDVKNITKQQLQSLIDNKVFENKELEYKDYSFTNGKISDKQKDKFMKEVAAFANTNGGTIIIGMQEDENRLPIHLSGAGLSIKEYDNWLSSFRQLVLSRIGALVEYGNIMERLYIPKPWHILATILNAKDYVANFGWRELSLPIERDLVFSLDGVCTEDIQMKVALKPVFDSLSNAFGFEKSNAFK